MKIPSLKLNSYGNDTLNYPPGFQISQVGLQRCLSVPVPSPSNKTPHSSQCLQDLAAIYIPHIQAWPDFDNLPGYPNNRHHNSLSSPARAAPLRFSPNEDGKRTLTP